MSLPELRQVFREEIENYFQENPIKEDPQLNMNERLSRREVAREYNISLGTIHNLMRSDKIKYEKVGRKTLFKREDVERCFNGENPKPREKHFPIKDVDIRDIDGISVRLFNVLVGARFNKLSEIAEIEGYQLRKIHGMGQQTFRELVYIMQKHGMIIKG